MVPLFLKISPNMGKLRLSPVNIKGKGNSYFPSIIKKISKSRYDLCEETKATEPFFINSVRILSSS